MNDFRSYSELFHSFNHYRRTPNSGDPKAPTKKSVVQETQDDGIVKRARIALQRAREQDQARMSEEKRQAMNQLQSIINAYNSSRKPLEKNSIERLISTISSSVRKR